MKTSLLARGIIAAVAVLAGVKAVTLFGTVPFGAVAAPVGGAHSVVAAPQPATPRAMPVSSSPAPAAPAPAAAPKPAPPQAEAAEPPPDAAVAAALKARREAVEERERALAAREAVFAAAERRLSARINELGTLQAALEAQAKGAQERDEANWRTLARLYEAMRPREAAAVFNDLDMPILIQVVNRMAERKAAPILGTMQPERVRLLTTELARLRAAVPLSTP
jgi:flagellar motility protein MotE (MotC chaperone)